MHLLSTIDHLWTEVKIFTNPLPLEKNPYLKKHFTKSVV